VRRRDYPAERRRRNERARREGWTGYDQRARWMPRFLADERGTAEYLAAKIADDPGGVPPRANSLFGKKVDLIVNGDGTHPSPLRVRLGPSSMWQARLVRAARGER
jgi:hypothetical protein